MRMHLVMYCARLCWAMHEPMSPCMVSATHFGAFMCVCLACVCVFPAWCCACTCGCMPVGMGYVHLDQACTLKD